MSLFSALLGAALAAFMGATSTPAALVKPGPVAAFDQTQQFSLYAMPTISGTASTSSLRNPLQLLIRGLSGPDNSTHSQTLEIRNGHWKLIPVQALQNGTYETDVVAGSTVLATSTLRIGLKSFPTVTSIPLAPYDVADGKLIRFSVQASPAGPVDITQLSFSLSTFAADVSGVTLSAFTDYEYTKPLGGAGSPPLNSTGVDPIENRVTIAFDTPLHIAAGDTYFFELDGTVTPSDSQYYVDTTLLSDRGVAAPATVASTTANIIWSPNTYGQPGVADSDWFSSSMLALPFGGIVAGRAGTPAPAPPTCSLQATSYIPSTQPVVVSWSSSNADYAMWNNGTREPVNGSMTFNSTVAGASVLTFYGKDGTTSCIFAVAQNNTGGSSSSSTSTSTQTQSGSGTATSTAQVVDSLLASTTSGTAPLSVKFTTTVNTAKSCNALTFTLGYGDSSTSTISVAKNTCNQVVSTFTHSYSKIGTSTAILYQGSGTSTSQVIQKQVIVVKAKTAFLLSPRTLVGAVWQAILNLVNY